jgi:hypothetical protein
VVLKQEIKQEATSEDEDFRTNDNLVIVSSQGESRIYIYRLHGSYEKYEFGLYLDNDLICQVTDGFKTIVYTDKTGHNNFLAKVEDVVEQHIFIEPDKDYYLKCDVLYGGYFPKVELKLMNREIGKKEFESIKTN